MSDFDRLQAENRATFMEHGPGLRFDYHHWVVARDRRNGKVRLGGLGGMGVGEMWTEDVPRLAGLPGYADAPELEWTPGAF